MGPGPPTRRPRSFGARLLFTIFAVAIAGAILLANRPGVPPALLEVGDGGDMFGVRYELKAVECGPVKRLDDPLTSKNESNTDDDFQSCELTVMVRSESLISRFLYTNVELRAGGAIHRDEVPPWPYLLPGAEEEITFALRVASGQQPELLVLSASCVCEGPLGPARPFQEQALAFDLA